MFQTKRLFFTQFIKLLLFRQITLIQPLSKLAIDTTAHISYQPKKKKLCYKLSFLKKIAYLFPLRDKCEYLLALLIFYYAKDKMQKENPMSSWNQHSMDVGSETTVSVTISESYVCEAHFVKWLSCNQICDNIFENILLRVSHASVWNTVKKIASCDPCGQIYLFKVNNKDTRTTLVEHVLVSLYSDIFNFLIHCIFILYCCLPKITDIPISLSLKLGPLQMQYVFIYLYQS